MVAMDLNSLLRININASFKSVSCPQTLPTVVVIDIIAFPRGIQSNVSNLSMEGC